MTKTYYVFHDDELIAEAYSFCSVVSIIFNAYKVDSSGEYWFSEL